VRDEQRHRRGPLPALDDDVDVQALDLRPELAELIEPPFLGAPVEIGRPVRDQVLHVAEIGAVIPARILDLVRPPRPLQPFSQVVEAGLGHRDLEGVHGGGRMIYRRPGMVARAGAGPYDSHMERP
jgi:hypothetical protein